jgi:hypothetical protein
MKERDIVHFSVTKRRNTGLKSCKCQTDRLSIVHLIWISADEGLSYLTWLPWNHTTDKTEGNGGARSIFYYGFIFVCVVRVYFFLLTPTITVNLQKTGE